MRVRGTAPLVAAVLMLPLLAACQSDTPDAEQTPDPPAAAQEDPAPVEDPVEDPAPAPAGDGAWTEAPRANPTVAQGELIATVWVGDLEVGVYQVGTAPALRDSTFVDAETEEPIVAVGDEVVYLNYIVTNHGEPVNLSSLLVEVDPRYVDWPYLGSVPGVRDAETFEQMGILIDGTTVEGYQESGVYVLGSGETFSFGDNMLYQPGKEMTIRVEYTPADAEGELLHDASVEAALRVYDRALEEEKDLRQ